MLPPVVDAGWLRAHRDRVVLADVRWYPDGRPGRDAFEASHLPGAVYLDVDTDLAGPPSDDAGRHPLPTPEAFAWALTRAGIGEHDTVIGYDDAGGVIAARLVWMLRAIGVDAALLDGGLTAWDGETEAGAAAAAPGAETAVGTSGTSGTVGTSGTSGTFEPRQWPADLLADLAEVRDRTHVVLDARPRHRYEGEPDALDPVPGHIPGSVSLPVREHVGPDGRLRSVEELRARFADAGVTTGESVVSSCGSGVTACHNLLILEHVGLGRGRLFPGSWSRYCRTGLPVATGPEPG